MTNDEFRELADALYAALRRYHEAMPTAAPAAPQAEPSAALIRAYNSGYMQGHHDTVESCFTDIHQSDMDTFHADLVAELGLSAAPQAEPKRDQPLLDLLAVIHCDGGHHTEAVGIEQSIKDAQAAVCELKRELAMGKREPLSDEQMRAVLIAEARRIAAQAGEKDPDSLPVNEEMLAQVMLAGRAVERAHKIGGSDAE